jgi:4-hydroxybenzoyl-CoA thioesterase
VSLRRPIRFEEVDAAGIVFFPRILGYCHEAMEDFFAPLEGGYARLILERKIGLPAVHLDVDFTAPLRYGDTIDIRTTVDRLGRTSASLRYAVANAASGVIAATIVHVVVATDLVRLRPIEWPADLRAVLESAPTP